MKWKLVVGAVCLVSLVACDKDKPAEEPKNDEAAKSDEAEKKDESAKQDAADKDDEAPKNEDKPKASGPTPIEGECVKDIKADAVARLSRKLDGEFEASEIAGRTNVREFAEDLDGDGEPEQEAAFFAYASNMESVLYLSNSGCAVHAGTFLVTSLSASEEKAQEGERRDIVTWTRGGCAGLEGDHVTYGFDAAKKRYVSKKKVSCDCNDKDPKRDPMCPKP